MLDETINIFLHGIMNDGGEKMNPYILSLEHKQASLEMVGGKGMSLSKLLTAGIPVPDGFSCYNCFIPDFC